MVKNIFVFVAIVGIEEPYYPGLIIKGKDSVVVSVDGVQRLTRVMPGYDTGKHIVVRLLDGLHYFGRQVLDGEVLFQPIPASIGGGR